MNSDFDRESAENFDWWRRTAEGQQALEQELRLIKRVLKPQVGESILDVGCGPGFHLKRFLEWNMRPIGIDISPAMVELARQRAGFHIPIHEGIAERLPFEENQFDIVIFITSLEFMDSPKTALREAVRVARKKVMIVIFNAYSFVALSCYFSGFFKSNFYRHARLLNLWKVKKMVRQVLNFNKLYWGSSGSLPMLGSGEDKPEMSHTQLESPFSKYIAVRVDLAVSVRELERKIHPALVKKSPSWAQRSYRVYL